MTRKKNRKITSPLPDDSIFGGGPTQINLDWPKLVGIDRSYIDSFKASADVVARSIARQDRHAPNRDAMFYALAYLYRHSLELQMKYILDLAYELNVFSEMPKCRYGHALLPLWKETRSALAEMWDDKPEVLDPIEQKIEEVHNADPTGQEFRYSMKREEKTLKPSLAGLPTVVSINRVKNTMNKIYVFLDGCILGFEAAWDSLRSNVDNY